MFTATRTIKLLRAKQYRALAFVMVGLLGITQPVLPAPVRAQDLTVTASFSDKQAVAPDEQIELRLSRPLKPSEGKLAVLIAQTDLTSLFVATGSEYKYNSKVLPLTAGNSEVVVYIVSPGNDWKEIARFRLQVGENKQAKEPVADKKVMRQQTPRQITRRAGFDKLDFIPAITLSLKSQPAESHLPAATRPARPTFTDLNLQSSFRTDLARGLFTSQTQFDFAGSSVQNEALRFGQLGDNAPKLDLASYLMQFQRGKASFHLGHTSFGGSRHLINSFSSRGMTIKLPLASRFDLSLAAMNGTSIVGVANFFGLDKRRHRLFGATLGAELIAERPTALRVELSALDGWLQPVSNFNQSNINDAERSRGLALRIIASDTAGRLRLDSGFAKSKFIAPDDPLLNQNRTVAPLPATPRNARYLDASLDILKDFSLIKGRKANLAFAFRHERVDPLFRSLGAATQADKHQNEFQLSGSLDEVTAQFSHLRFNDNLRNIPSILKSLTRAERFSVGAPAAQLFGIRNAQSPLVPRISYSLDRTHQFGTAIPVRGGFEQDPANIPDFVATNHSFSADWQLHKYRVGYRFNRSYQDNRQTGRETSDFINMTNGVSVGLAATAALDLNGDFSADSARNRATNRLDRTLRFAPSVNWRMNAGMSLTANLSMTLAGDDAETNRSRNIEFDAQWSYRLAVERSRFRKLQSQLFIRYANRYAHTRDRLFDSNNLTRAQILNLGLSITFF